MVCSVYLCLASKKGHSLPIKVVAPWQVPFQEVVSSVQEQLRAITTGDFNMHVPVVKEERAFNNIKFAAISIPCEQLLEVLQEVPIQYSLWFYLERALLDLS